MGVVIHDDMWAAAQMMPARQREGFIYAICAYSFDGTEPVGSPAWLPTFTVVKDRLDMGAKASERGRAMANARWGNRQDAQAGAQAHAEADAQAHAQAYAQADAQAHAQASGVPDAEDEVEVEKEKTPIAPFVREVVGYLNERTGKAFRPTTPKTRSLVSARMAEGFTVEDFKRVIDTMAAKWGQDEKMRSYLRPETLFDTKFEGYLNEEPPKGVRDVGAWDF